MKILALEFSSAQRSVAVVEGGEAANLGTVPNIIEVIETGGPSTKAVGMIEEALRLAQLEREQIECLAIGLGPGSYTGIRAAISVAQGWQLAREIKLVGVSSADAIAAQAAADGLLGAVAVVIDAQRGEFYLGMYEVGGRTWRSLEPLRLAAVHEVQACQRAGQMLVGPEISAAFPGAKTIFPRAAAVGTLASKSIDFVSGEMLQPIYLRQTAFVKAVRPNSS